MDQLRGQVAIITGASQGIGEATALAFAKAGAHVALIARRQRQLDSVAAACRAHAVDALAFAGDIREPETARRFVDAILQRHGRIDVLVNNAGGSLGERRLRDVTIEDWQSTVDLNLVAPFLLVRAVLPNMRSQHSGTIVNVASRAGMRPTAVTAGSAYAAAKAGLIMFTNFINFEEQQHGIRATVVSVGTTDTPAHVGERTPDYERARRNWLRSSDVADAILFVASRPPNVTIDEVIIRPSNPRFDTQREQFLIDS